MLRTEETETIEFYGAKIALKRFGQYSNDDFNQDEKKEMIRQAEEKRKKIRFKTGRDIINKEISELKEIIQDHNNELKLNTTYQQYPVIDMSFLSKYSVDYEQIKPTTIPILGIATYKKKQIKLPQFTTHKISKIGDEYIIRPFVIETEWQTRSDVDWASVNPTTSINSGNTPLNEEYKKLLDENNKKLKTRVMTVRDLGTIRDIGGTEITIETKVDEPKIIIPPEIEKIVKKEENQFELYIVKETQPEEWNSEITSQITSEDPLLIGYHSGANKFFLLGVFDPTPLEKFISENYIKKI